MTTFDLIAHLRRQRIASLKNFGPHQRVVGVIAHIRKELIEIEADPSNLVEWIDVILLICDGAMRQGFTPEQIAAALAGKQAINEARRWPDWRTVSPDQPIEHIEPEAQP